MGVSLFSMGNSASFLLLLCRSFGISNRLVIWNGRADRTTSVSAEMAVRIRSGSERLRNLLNNNTGENYDDDHNLIVGTDVFI